MVLSLSCGRRHRNAHQRPRVPRAQLSAKLSVFQAVTLKGGDCGAEGLSPHRRYHRLHHVLTSSELEHAQGELDAPFKRIFVEIRAPSALSNLQATRRWPTCRT